MPTRNVVITPQQEYMISSLVDTGRYKNASEVLREGLRLLERREAEDLARIDGLRAAIDEAESCLQNGRFETYTPELLDEIDSQEKAEYNKKAGNAGN